MNDSHWFARAIRYTDRLAWVEDMQYGGPLYSLGASSIGAIFGHGTSNMPGPWAVWQKARTWDAAEAVDAEEFREEDDGIAWEGPILRYGERRGWYELEEVADEPFRVVSQIYPWARISPDAIAKDSTGMGIVDSKCRFGFHDWPEQRAGMALAGEADIGSTAALRLFPEAGGAKYLMQAAYSLAVAGPEFLWFDFVIGLHFRDVRRIRLHRNDAYVASILERVAEWRERHLVQGKEPAYDESVECRRHLATYEREGEGSASPEVLGLLRDYERARLAEKVAKVDKQKAQSLIIAAGNEADTRVFTFDGEGRKGRASIAKNGAVRVTGLAMEND